MPEPGAAMESILALVPETAEDVVVLREDERGMRLEWRGGARPFRFDLDPPGARVFRRIDGVATLGELVEAFAREERLSFFESAALWIGYTRTLVQRNLVRFREPSP